MPLQHYSIRYYFLSTQKIQYKNQRKSSNAQNLLMTFLVLFFAHTFFSGDMARWHARWQQFPPLENQNHSNIAVFGLTYIGDRGIVRVIVSLSECIHPSLPIEIGIQLPISYFMTVS